MDIAKGALPSLENKHSLTRLITSDQTAQSTTTDTETLSPADTTTASQENVQSSTMDGNDTGKAAKRLHKTHPLDSFIATARPTDVIRHQNTRSRSRTLSIEGRRAMLREFRQRRPAQRKAIIDSMLEGIPPEHIAEIYSQIDLSREAYARQFDQMRELWSRELEWGPRPSWSSDETTWSPESTGWGDTDTEIAGDSITVSEKEPDSEWYCGEKYADQDEGRNDEHTAQNDFPQDTAMSSEKKGRDPLSSAAGRFGDLAEEILPYILDKDEPDFTRTLEEGIEFSYARGQNYMWQHPAERTKPPPGPSGLRKAWKPEDMALEDIANSQGQDW